jgi:hypothetical protein
LGLDIFMRAYAKRMSAINLMRKGCPRMQL